MLIDTINGMFISTSLGKYTHLRPRQLVPLQIPTCVLKGGRNLVTLMLIGEKILMLVGFARKILTIYLPTERIHDSSLPFATANSFQSGTAMASRPA